MAGHAEQKSENDGQKRIFFGILKFFIIQIIKK